MSPDLPLHDLQVLLNAAARHREAGEREQQRIEAEHGVRWSEMVRLVGFEHSAFCPPDAMHNTALGKYSPSFYYILLLTRCANQQG